MVVIIQSLKTKQDLLLVEQTIQNKHAEVLGQVSDIRNTVEQSTHEKQSMKAKYNNLIRVLFEGLHIEGTTREELLMDDVSGGGGGGGGQSQTIINITNSGHIYTIEQPWKHTKESNGNPFVNGYVDTEGNVWDFSQISLVEEDVENHPLPTGFALSSEGQITWGDAFLNLNDSVTLKVTHINGTLGYLRLYDLHSELYAPIAPRPLEITGDNMEFTLLFPFKNNKDMNNLVNINGQTDAGNNVWDFSLISSVEAPQWGLPPGFVMTSDGEITTWGDAFSDVSSVVTVKVTHNNGFYSILHLQDNGSS
jgi:hypothetical protein